MTIQTSTMIQSVDLSEMDILWLIILGCGHGSC